MNKKKLFAKQQMTLMFFNLLAFTLIFAIFGLIISSVMHHYLFVQVDEELLAFKEGVEYESEWRKLDRDQELRLIYPPNPRILTLMWDKNGEIINQAQIGTRLYDDFFKNLNFKDNQLGEIINLQIADQYSFRTVTFEVDDSIFIQAMINVDAEENVYQQFKVILIVCSVLFILLSITASYILSRKTMRPIILSWNRQTDFVENASHELRTPLTIIQNKLELLLTAPNEKIVDKFENIALSLSETRRLSKLTSDLLTLARADSAETLLEKESIDVDDFMSRICAPYIEMAELEEKRLSLDLESQVIIEADQSRLHQLIIILLDNALKYTSEKESICVKTRVRDHKLLLEVSDTGMGICEDNKKRIFDRFYRADTVRTRHKGGSGLGLSIAQWIVQSHGGTIHVADNSPKGTKFIIKLPNV